MPRTSPPANAPRRTAWQGAGLPLAATASCFAIILLAGQLAAYVPPSWQGSWTAHIVARQPHVIDRFFPFDAVWYQRIADSGYVWDPHQPSLKQDDAFFPLWPLLLRFIAACVPVAAVRWIVVACAAGFALASVFAFAALARRTLPAPDARVATLLFALYPAASFLLLSYPTGLMNLLCILALLAMLDERFLMAAVFSGLLTAIGPLGLGTALTVCALALLRTVLAQQRRESMLWPVLKLLAVCAVSVSGLVLFLFWQWFAVGDPLAFIKAQEAWAIPLPWPKRIPVAFVQLLILPDFIAAMWELRHAVRAATPMALQASLEKSLNLAAEGLGLVALIASMRLASRPVVLQGVFTMALFIWFHSVSRPGNSTLRLTYCIMALFLGAAWLLRGRPRIAAATIGVSACLLAGGAFLTAAGYHVV